MTVARRTLGRSGITISALGMGCWAIGGRMAAGDQQLGYAGVEDDDALAGLRRARELGVDFFDTADAYGAGHSETLLGQALGADDQVRIATKFGNTVDESARQLIGTDVSRQYVRRAVEASLRRLSRERIDLYQLHTPDISAVQADDLLETLETLVDEGSIGWFGISTDDPAHVEQFAGAPHLTAVQLQLNVLDDNREMLDVAERHDLAALCRSPLAMGLLGGRYTIQSRMPTDDIRGRQPEWLRWFADGRPAPEFLDRIASVRDILTADGRSLAQGALAWILARHSRTVPLPGFRTAAQVEDNAGTLAAAALTAEEFSQVELALGRPSTR